jgi:hypothetical protein
MTSFCKGSQSRSLSVAYAIHSNSLGVSHGHHNQGQRRRSNGRR